MLNLDSEELRNWSLIAVCAAKALACLRQWVPEKITITMPPRRRAAGSAKRSKPPRRKRR